MAAQHKANKLCFLLLALFIAASLLCFGFTRAYEAEDEDFSEEQAIADPPYNQQLKFKIVANGHAGDLIFTINNNNVLTGTVYGNLIDGYWSPIQKKIVFQRKLGNQPQVYEGYLHTGPNVYIRYFSGIFLAFPNTYVSPDRHEYGWYAYQV